MDNTVVGRAVSWLAKAVAIAGGVVLTLLVIMVVVSVAGRTLIWAGLKPIPGDYELVEAGVLFAIFAFMPWCHLERGHAIVGILTDRFPPRVKVIIELLMDILMLLVAAFILWRHWAGMMDKLSYQETTFILRFPLWWSYAAGLIGAVAFVIVAAYCVVRSAVNSVSRDPQMPTSGMAE